VTQSTFVSLDLQVYTTDSSLHSASVNSVAFAPHELGLKVAAASSDGSASVLTYNSTEGKWDQQKVPSYPCSLTDRLQYSAVFGSESQALPETSCSMS